MFNMRSFVQFSFIACAVLFLQACDPGNRYSYTPWSSPVPYETDAQSGDENMSPEVGWQNKDQIESEALKAPENGYGSNPQKISHEHQVADATNEEHFLAPLDAFQTKIGKLLNVEQQGDPENSFVPQPVDQIRPVTVALLVPLSGQHKNLGQSMLNAGQLALFEIGGENFELLPVDTKGTEHGAQNAAIKAIEEGADLILGPVFSSSLANVSPIARRNGVPVISFSTDWRRAGGDTYVMGFLPFAQVARVTNYAVQQGQRNFAMLAPRSDYSNVVYKTLQYSLSRYRTRVTKIARYEALQSDLGPIVSDFAEYDTRVALLEEEKQVLAIQMEEDPENEALIAMMEELDKQVTLGTPSFDTLMLPVGGQNLKSVSTLLSYYDVDAKNVQLIGTGLWDDISLTREPAMYGAWFAAPDPKLRKEFEQKYKDTFGNKPARLATLAYDATALAAVLTKTNNTSGSPFTRQRLTHARGFAGIDGIFRFRHDGLIERGLAVLEIKPGKIKTLDPAPKAFAAR